MELEAHIARQQKDFVRKDAVNTEIVNNIERKLARLDEVEGKLTIFVRILMDRFYRSWSGKPFLATPLIHLVQKSRACSILLTIRKPEQLLLFVLKILRSSSHR